MRRPRARTVGITAGIVAALCVGTMPVGAGHGPAAAAGTAREGGGGRVAVARAAFERANAAYEAGRYAEAADAYREALAAGAVDADLYYNLGNAEFKAGRMGRAVLAYERALRLAPRMEDARVNLGTVRALLPDAQFVRKRGRLGRVLAWYPSRVNVSEAAAVAGALYLLAVLAGAAYVFRETRPVSAVYRVVSVVSPGRLVGLGKSADILAAAVVATLLWAAAAATAVNLHRRAVSGREAVVVVPEAGVHSEPREGAVVQFAVHEGTTLDVVDTRPGWVRVELPGELFGWVPATAVERVAPPARDHS